MPMGPITYNGQATLRGEKASKTLCAVYLAYSVFTNKHNKSLGRRMLFDKLGRKYLTPHVATIKAAPEEDSSVETIKAAPEADNLDPFIGYPGWYPESGGAFLRDEI